MATPRTETTIAPSRAVAKKLAFAIDDVTPTPTGTIILGYHRVGGHTTSPVDLDRGMFRRQIAHLRAAHRVRTLEEAVAGLQLPESESLENQVVLTFDDGTADFLDEVVPLLVEFNLPATVYVATDHIDSKKSFPSDGKPISWAGLRDAAATGLVNIGAHTHTHRLLDRCPLSVVRQELDRSNARIEDEIGVSPRHFAYPKAVRAGGLAEREVRQRYLSAAIAGTRPNRAPDVDLHRLYRSPIQVADGWEGFRRKLSGGMRAEDDLRRLVNRYRYRRISR